MEVNNGNKSECMKKIESIHCCSSNFFSPSESPDEVLLKPQRFYVDFPL